MIKETITREEFDALIIEATWHAGFNKEKNDLLFGYLQYASQTMVDEFRKAMAGA